VLSTGINTLPWSDPGATDQSEGSWNPPGGKSVPLKCESPGCCATAALSGDSLHGSICRLRSVFQFDLFRSGDAAGAERPLPDLDRLAGGQGAEELLLADLDIVIGAPAVLVARAAVRNDLNPEDAEVRLDDRTLIDRSAQAQILSDVNYSGRSASITLAGR
jgi:hypothetical protein